MKFMNIFCIESFELQVQYVHVHCIINMHMKHLFILLIKFKQSLISVPLSLSLSLSPSSQNIYFLRFMEHYIIRDKTVYLICTIAHAFSKKWLQNYAQFLLHFLIHIDVLMLCRKFELIPSSNFRVMTI